jgi:hypothetical protein
MLLMRIDTNKLIVAISLAVGIAAIYFSILYFPYLLFVFAVLFIKGCDDQEIREIWSFIMLSMTIYVGNQIWWGLKYSVTADYECRYIELACIILTPVGLLLIKDAKYVRFDLYKSN